MLNRAALIVALLCAATVFAAELNPAQLSGPDAEGRPGQGIEAIGDIDNMQNTPDMYGPEGAFLPFHHRGDRSDRRTAVNQVNRAMLAMQAANTAPATDSKPATGTSAGSDPVKPAAGSTNTGGAAAGTKPLPAGTTGTSTGANPADKPAAGVAPASGDKPATGTSTTGTTSGDRPVAGAVPGANGKPATGTTPTTGGEKPLPLPAPVKPEPQPVKPDVAGPVPADVKNAIDSVVGGIPNSDSKPATGSSTATACDCSTKDAATKPCCTLKCLMNPLDCAKEFGAPTVNQDVIKDRLAKCDATKGLVWCSSTSACVKIGEKCAGLVEESVNLIGGLAPGERCLASAGFTWCAAKGQCIQGWKESCPIGGQLPGQKCLGAAGYSWCDSTQKCIRTWEEKCPASSNTAIGGKLPGEKCLGAAGYSWCESAQKCIRSWEEKCPAPLTPASTEASNKCLALIAGYSWCAALNACATQAECTKVSQQVIGGKLPGEKCLGAAGYTWCASKNKCLQAWIERCPTA